MTSDVKTVAYFLQSSEDADPSATLSGAAISGVAGLARRQQDRAVTATRHRITTGEQDIELWYSDDHDWLGLSSTTRGGRQLYYRRVTPPSTAGTVSDD